MLVSVGRVLGSVRSATLRRRGREKARRVYLEPVARLLSVGPTHGGVTVVTASKKHDHEH
jgi:hypothetical protein